MGQTVCEYKGYEELETAMAAEKGREIPCVVTAGMMEASSSLSAESLLEAVLVQIAVSARCFFKESPEKLVGVQRFTLICDQYSFNSIQELADSLKPGWMPPAAKAASQG